MVRQLGLLKRARLEQEYDQAKERAEKLRILHNIGMSIASALELEQLLTRIVEAAVFITQAEEGSLLLLDEATQELNLRAQKGLGERYARGFRIPVHDSLAGEVLQSGRPQRVTAADQEVKVVTGYLVTSILYVPVGIQGRSIGVLAVDNQASDQPFSEDDENLLLILAGYAAIALENARCLEEAERRFRTLAALHGAGELDPEQDQLPEEEIAGVRLGDPDTDTLEALTPQFLATVVSPCLSAISELQHVLDEFAGRPPREVRVLAVTQSWPVPASLQGARESLQAIRQVILPWGPEYAEGHEDVAIEATLDLLTQIQPDLREARLISYVTRLLPVVEILLSTPLRVSRT
jgi:GAF domain-containing protein